MRHDPLRARAGSNRMLNTAPGRAEIVCLANIKIARTGGSAVRGIGPVELPVRAPGAVVAGLVQGELRVRHPAIRGAVVRLVRGVVADHVHRSAAVIPDERALDWEG